MVTGNIQVVCHRGANAVAPENTFAAAEQCLAWGAHYLEVDVRTSKDGLLYNLHDARVDRTTNGTGFLKELTAEEIDRLDAGSWFDPKFAGEKLPRLERLLESIRGRAGVFFDVKEAYIGALIALVRRLELEKDCFFWFDRAQAAQEFRILAPDLLLKVNAATVAEVERAQSEFAANIIEVNPSAMTTPLREACRQRGMRVMALQLQNDPTAFRSIIEGGADLVNLNHADAFFQVLEEMKIQRC